MRERENIEVTELEDKDLDQVAGGMEDAAIGLDISCKDNEQCPTNSGNCVSGCSCT